MKAANRITNGSPKSYGMFDQANRRFGDDPDVIHLELGKPCADTPLPIKQAAVDALMRGEVHYSDFRGTRALRDAIVAKLWHRNKLDVTADEVLVTNGLTHASFASFLALLNEGDEVILLAPYYPQHVGKIELAGGKPVIVDLDRDRGFAIDIAAIEAAVTDRTRIILLVNPSNPTGRAHSLGELQQLADLAIRHDLIVFADEVYEDVLYDDARHISIGALPGMKERTISLYAFTKSYAMDGWRIGYLVAPLDIMPALLSITTSDVTHVNTFIQAGALAALTGPDHLLRDLVDIDREKRDIVVAALNEMRGVTCAMPAATMYAFADIRGTGLRSQELADRLLETTKVVVESGSFYGPAGEGFMRVCFSANPLDVLQEGMARMASFFRRL